MDDKKVAAWVLCVSVLAAGVPALADWSEQQRITASDGAEGDLFGDAVSIDGDYAIAGAYGTGSSQGSAYIFQRSGSSWSQVAKLTASDAAADDEFASSVSISGDTVIVGASERATGAGAAYIFEKPVGGWADATETAKLAASGAVTGDYFGWSVSISGDTAIVGALGRASHTGAAYIFEKPVGGWVGATETAMLTASDAVSWDRFGLSVSISGDTAIVGTPYHDLLRGSAYIFAKPVGSWTTTTETAKLTAFDAPLAGFGWSVSISGDTVAVGAPILGPGSTYIFEKPLGSWTTTTETAELTASDGATEDAFGCAVSVHGDTVLVGASGDDDHGAVSGSAYIFEKPVGSWTTTTETQKLTASDAGPGDQFGYEFSVSISGNYAIVGAPTWDGADKDNCGAAYIYVPEPCSAAFLALGAMALARKRRRA